MPVDSTYNLVALGKDLLDAGKEGVLYAAQKIQEVAPIAWDIMYRQILVDAIGDLVITVFLMILSTIGVVCSYKWYEERKVDFYKKERRDAYGCKVDLSEYCGGQIFLLILSSFAGLLFLIMSVFNGIYLCKVLIVPEYYVIKELLEVISGK